MNHSKPILSLGLLAAVLAGCTSDLTPQAGPSVMVMGTATGLDGTAVLQLNGGDSLNVAADGPFSFSASLSPGVDYAVTVQTQPLGQTCSLANDTGTTGSGNVTNVVLACVSNDETLGVTVSGLQGTLVLKTAAGDSLTLTADGAYVFPKPVRQTSTYVITVKTQPASQTCSVANGSGVVGGSDVSNVTVTCVTHAHTVGGAVSGLTGALVLQDNGSDLRTIATDGGFTFGTPVVEGAPYLVTVRTQPAGETCSVTHGSGVMGTSNVDTVAVVCAPNAFTVGVTVSGLTGTVIIQDNAADDLAIGGNGAFTFPNAVAQGAAYSVTVLTQPATQTCSVVNGSGTMGGSNVTNVAVVCSTNAYTVGGAISGLSGTVVLQDNGGDDNTITSNGSFTFATPIAEGGTYDVTVATQPTAQTCTVTNDSGTMGGSDVTNVSVTCVSNTTTLTVDSTGVIPVNGTAGTLTVTNTGSNPAVNVSAALPGGWTAVTQDASGCATVAAGSTCTLSFTSTKPYVAQAGIAITADNVSSSPTTTLAFSMSGYLVFAVPTASTASVLAASDAGSGVSWAPAFDDIPGIDESSTSPPDACNGATDGACDTTAIVGQYGAPYGYAAGLCNQIVADNTGAVAVGTWYLPSICELGGSAQGAGCAAGVANVDTNLVQLGFGGLDGDYAWSATEFSGVPQAGAWFEYFSSGGNSGQGAYTKSGNLSVRCVRSMSY